ncbi:MAG: BrnT family toxin [Bauldia sp.]
MRIVWDEPKRLANIEKHGLDFAELSVEFFEAATIYPAKAGRLMALAALNGRPVIAVVFLPLGTEGISIISMRTASLKERKLV